MFFFATIANAEDYSLDEVLELRRVISPEELQKVTNITLTEVDVEPLLRRIRNTAPGYDNIPAWVFRLCSYELAEIIAFIINSTFRSGIVPSNWLTAIVTPVPKITIPQQLSDFRPISVTPIISRLAEKLLVRYWLRPALAEINLLDQYAFKPTGSTNCALVNCIDHVTRMLETNEYVRCMLIDFSKAFDTVDHAILLRKLNLLKLPVSIKNWINYFLTGRTQITKVCNNYSSCLSINRSIVQGSGIGPSLYILMEGDLHPLCCDNVMFKYADDTNLLVPERSAVTIQQEFAHVQEWACRNKMTINLSKTKELVFHRPHPSKHSISPSFSNIELVEDAKLLGVLLSHNLSFEKHLTFVLASCSKRFYLLKNLRDGGMPLCKLSEIFCSLVVSRVSYCVSAWGGFLNAEQTGKINALFKRARRYGFTEHTYDFNGIIESADVELFCRMQREEHCLHNILPPIRHGFSELRNRGHNFVLPLCKYDIYKKSFLPRSLYKFL